MKNIALILMVALLCTFIFAGCISPKEQDTNTDDNSNSIIYDYEIHNDVGDDIDVDYTPNS